MKPEFRLQFHPTPKTTDPFGVFECPEEMANYKNFEIAHTQLELKNYWAALPNDRNTMAEALAKKREATYKIWKNFMNPTKKVSA